MKEDLVLPGDDVLSGLDDIIFSHLHDLQVDEKYKAIILEKKNRSHRYCSEWCKEENTCPYCHCHCCDPEYVDVGVPGCNMQVTPVHCEYCGASQIGGYNSSKCSKTELTYGWFKPYNTVQILLFD